MKKFVKYLEIVFSVMDMLILILFAKKYVSIKNPNVHVLVAICVVILILSLSYVIFELLDDIENDIINGVVIKLNNKEDK